mmetsp:Transcript_3613/g.8264  ORF Transcript_3613/g.8264 Transcript_3613/m.8264 type:complete len:233 (+) Transcript_3613:345-1043(+)
MDGRGIRETPGGRRREGTNDGPLERRRVARVLFGRRKRQAGPSQGAPRGENKNLQRSHRGGRRSPPAGGRAIDRRGDRYRKDAGGLLDLQRKGRHEPGADAPGRRPGHQVHDFCGRRRRQQEAIPRHLQPGRRHAETRQVPVPDRRGFRDRVGRRQGRGRGLRRYQERLHGTRRLFRGKPRRYRSGRDRREERSRHPRNHRGVAERVKYYRQTTMLIISFLVAMKQNYWRGM